MLERTTFEGEIQQQDYPQQYGHPKGLRAGCQGNAPSCLLLIEKWRQKEWINTATQWNTGRLEMKKSIWKERWHKDLLVLARWV
jgi:hypothetical protein